MSAEPKPVGVQDALDNLVNQFSDPMSFFRELIQNALDAGTPEMEIYFDFQEEEGGKRGVMTAHVDDFGEGMDRSIIDTRLTRLFSSSKEGDLTKIGRFGIGFVSVFAIQPDAVCLDTSRGGENWRILFKRDRTFVKIQRDEPVDGTKIQIIKAVTRPEFDEFVRRAREVITFWCKHVKNEIVFEDETINQPLEIDTPVKVHYSEQDTDIVVGYPRDGNGFHGFYNKGLTLYEGFEADHKGISFKINSRFLEHTLTRDNVLRDENFEKAMDRVRRLTQNDLREKLFDMLEEGVKTDKTEGMDFLYVVLTDLLSNDQRDVLKRIDGRVFFKTVSGREVPVREIRRAHGKGRLFCEDQPGELTEAMEKEELVVVRTGTHAKAYQALGWIIGKEGFQGAPWASQVYCRPLPAKDPDEAQAWKPLHRATARLLELQGVKISDVEFGHFHYRNSSIRELVAITQREFGDLTPREEVLTVGESMFSRRRVLVVNADDPTVHRLIRLSNAEPELAAYFLMKLFYLRGELTTTRDGELAAGAMTLRERRRAADEMGGGHAG